MRSVCLQKSKSWKRGAEQRKWREKGGEGQIREVFWRLCNDLIAGEERGRGGWGGLPCFDLGSMRRDRRTEVFSTEWEHGKKWSGEEEQNEFNSDHATDILSLYSFIGEAFGDDRDRWERRPKSLRAGKQDNEKSGWGRAEQVDLLSFCDTLYIPNTEDSSFFIVIIIEKGFRQLKMLQEVFFYRFIHAKWLPRVIIVQCFKSHSEEVKTHQCNSKAKKNG